MRSRLGHKIIHCILLASFVVAPFLCLCGHAAPAATPASPKPIESESHSLNHSHACCDGQDSTPPPVRQNADAPLPAHPSQPHEPHCPHCGDAPGTEWMNDRLIAPAGLALLQILLHTPDPLFISAYSSTAVTFIEASSQSLPFCSTDLLHQKCVLQI